MKIRKWSLIRKTIVMSILILIICNTIVSVITAYNAEKVIKPEIKNQITKTLSVINAGIDGDKVQEMIENEKDINGYYDEIYDYLNNIYDKSDISSIYIIGKLKDKNYHYLVDSISKDDQWFMEFGSLYGEIYDGGKGFEQEDEALEKGSYVTEVYSYDEEEDYITGFSAIYNRSNQPVAILCIDITANGYKSSIGSLMRLVVFNMIFGGTIISLFISVYLLKALKPMEQIKNVVSEVAAGNLNVSLEVKSHDEIGIISEIINRMVLNLKKIISQIIDDSHKISDYSEDLINNSEKLLESSEQVVLSTAGINEGVSLQDDHINSIIEKINNINEAISNIVDNSKVTSKDIEKSYNYANNGEKVIKESTLKILDANSSMENSMERLSVLAEKIKDITKFVEIINGISEQTNLLALNAAIESARAGEAGKGFSIVAEEVRILADQSAQTTCEISDILNDIDERTKDVLLSINDTSIHIKNGVESSKSAEKYFSDILCANVDVRDSNIEVRKKVEECSNETKEIVCSLKQLEDNSGKLLEKCTEIMKNTDEQFKSSKEIEEFAKLLMEISNDLNLSIKALACKE